MYNPSFRQAVAALAEAGGSLEKAVKDDDYWARVVDARGEGVSGVHACVKMVRDILDDVEDWESMAQLSVFLSMRPVPAADLEQLVKAAQ